VQLSLQVTGQHSGQPDITPLKQNFDILATRSGSQVNIINGAVDARTTWTLTLSPRERGTITIPSLFFNGEQSPPLTLEVTEASTAPTAAGDLLFIESQIDRDTPYLQQMVHYRVSLFYRAQLAEGQLSDPQLDHALIHRLGEDREYQSQRNGVNYQVIERNYALFPQKSGPLTIPAPVLDARIITSTPSRNSRHPFDNFFNNRRASTQAVRVRGEPQTFQVRPRPASHQNGPWLPAESVTLSEQWQGGLESAQVGVPLSRTITLQANAVAGSLLPELTPDPAEGFKLYPEPAQQTSKLEQQTVVGTLQRKIAYIPTQAGSFTLPPLQLRWWNSQTDRAERVTLPARTVNVAPASVDAEMDVDVEPAAPIQTEEATTTAPVDKPYTLWPWIALLFALLWLATLAIWWIKSRSLPPHHADHHTSVSTEQRCRHAKKQFIAACRADDPQLTRSTLLQWAACHWPNTPPTGLEALAKKLNNPAVEELLSQLDQNLYQHDPARWRGEMLLRALDQLPDPAPTMDDGNLLKPLYP